MQTSSLLANAWTQQTYSCSKWFVYLCTIWDFFICRAGDWARFEEGNSILAGNNRTLTVVVMSDIVPTAMCSVNGLELAVVTAYMVGSVVACSENESGLTDSIK